MLELTPRVLNRSCLGVKNIGKPCAGELHARFDEGGQAKHSTAGLVRHRQAKAAATDRPSLPDEEPVLYSTYRPLTPSPECSVYEAVAIV